MILKPLVNLYLALPMPIQRFLRYSVGGLLLTLGIIGLLLPILPGIPLLLLGSWLLGWNAGLQSRLARWYPLGRFANQRDNRLRRGSS